MADLGVLASSARLSPSVRPRAAVPGAAGAAAWALAAGVSAWWPNDNPFMGYTGTIVAITAGIAGAIAAAAAVSVIHDGVAAWVHWAAPWLVVSGLLATVWQLSTAKLGLLDPPYWAPAQVFVNTFHEDGRLLLESTWRALRPLAIGYAMLRPLAIGYAIGATVGFLIGVAMGWSKPESTDWVAG